MYTQDRVVSQLDTAYQGVINFKNKPYTCTGSLTCMIDLFIMIKYQGGNVSLALPI